MRMHASLLVVAGGLLLLAAPFTAKAAEPKACDALPSQTAALLAGGPVSSAIDMGPTCAYSIDSGGSVSLVFQQIPPGKEAMSIQTLQSNVIAGAKAESISGFPGPAVLTVRPTQDSVLAVGYHAHVVSLSTPGNMTPALKAAMIQAMKQALAKP